MSKTRGQAASTSPYEGIHFKLADLEREVSSFDAICRSFLAQDCREVLRGWLTDLKNYCSSSSQYPWRWTISELQPIRTRSTPEFEPKGRQGGFDVHGELSCVWTVVNLKPKGSKKHRGKLPGQLICLNGLASSTVKIFRSNSADPAPPIAQWQFEVGDHQSPGCHFHIGIGRFGLQNSELPVPRLPSILLTPIDALDFLLGEIFQDSWRKNVDSESGDGQVWAGEQKQRLARLLKWKQEQIEASGGSAWNYLKHRRPDADIFLS